MSDYNGWTNRWTWLVSLWIDNDPGTYHYWREEAAEAAKSGKQGQAVYDFAHRLEDEIEAWIMEDEPASLKSDLLLTALSRVNWFEIVEHWFDELEE